ncbi:MAG: hypothetical protein QGG36_29430 [Pirellulaceae bacterium]|nr:hypothetical protein [Pirellulaceae bacterium]
MFVRFTTNRQSEDSHSLTGVFQAAFELRDSGDLADYEEAELNEALAWLKMHLKSPGCLREPGNERALSWFHPRAVRPMQYVWRMVRIIQDHNVFIEVHRTDDPGIVIYEDGWQVVAKPRRKKTSG